MKSIKRPAGRFASLAGVVALALSTSLAQVHAAAPSSLARQSRPAASSAAAPNVVVGLTQLQAAMERRGDEPMPVESWMRTDLLFETVTVTKHRKGFIVNAKPSKIGEAVAGNRGLWFLHELEARAKAGTDANGRPYWNESIASQLVCHLAGYPLSLPEYDLESWRPNVEPYSSLLVHQCNPS